MPRDFIIQPSRFQGVLPSNADASELGGTTLTWVAPTHDLKQVYPGRPPGSDRATDFTVNAYLRITFNKPIGDAALRIIAAPMVTMSGVQASPLPAISVNALGFPGTVTVVLASQSLTFFGPPLPEVGSSFQVISLPAYQFVANLGQSVSYRITFARYDLFRDPLLLDATMTGAFVSSDPI